MLKVRVLLAVGVAVALAAAAARAADEPPKPAPEFDKLKALEGTWDAAIKMGPNESKGSVTYKVDVGGMWVCGDFSADLGGQKFQGKGLDSYDPMKKKYVSVWVDSMAPTPLIMEGTYDKDGKVLTMTGEGVGMDGKPVKMKTTSEMKDKDTIAWAMYNVDKDGKAQEFMSITYKRKK
jgi:hypothetical protein